MPAPRIASPSPSSPDTRHSRLTFTGEGFSQVLEMALSDRAQMRGTSIITFTASRRPDSNAHKRISSPIASKRPSRDILPTRFRSVSAISSFASSGLTKFCLSFGTVRMTASAPCSLGDVRTSDVSATLIRVPSAHALDPMQLIQWHCKGRAGEHHGTRVSVPRRILATRRHLSGGASGGRSGGRSKSSSFRRWSSFLAPGGSSERSTVSRGQYMKERRRYRGRHPRREAAHLQRERRAADVMGSEARCQPGRQLCHVLPSRDFRHPQAYYPWREPLRLYDSMRRYYYGRTIRLSAGTTSFIPLQFNSLQIQPDHYFDVHCVLDGYGHKTLPSPCVTLHSSPFWHQRRHPATCPLT